MGIAKYSLKYINLYKDLNNILKSSSEEEVNTYYRKIKNLAKQLNIPKKNNKRIFFFL